jgi:hypothetical protein
MLVQETAGFSSAAQIGSIDRGGPQCFPLQTTAKPSASTATQNFTDTHETEVSPYGSGSTFTGLDHVRPSKTMASPEPSTAAQKC